MAKRLVFPSYPDLWGFTSLVSNDFDKRPQLGKLLAAYDTVGSQNYFWRHQQDYYGVVYQQAGSEVDNSVVFRLQDCVGYNQFQEIFDQYKLRAAHVRIHLQSQLTGASSSKLIPGITSALDYDDANNTVITSLIQYDTCVQSPPNTGVARTLIPRMALAAYGGNTFSGYANVEPQWIDIATPAVEHYGVKWGIPAGAVGQTDLLAFQVNVTYFWEFRASR